MFTTLPQQQEHTYFTKQEPYLTLTVCDVCHIKQHHGWKRTYTQQRVVFVSRAEFCRF
jgi:hypothetical protein